MSYNYPTCLVLPIMWRSNVECQDLWSFHRVPQYLTHCIRNSYLLWFSIAKWCISATSSDGCANAVIGGVHESAGARAPTGLPA
jgi:hypothetical protein